MLSKGSKGHIIILIGADPESDRADELEGYEQAEAISASLESLGYTSETMLVTSDLTPLKKLSKIAPKCIFNLVEEIDGDCKLAYLVPAMLESQDLAFTGASACSYAMSTDKILTKKLLKIAGLPTPAWSADGTDLPPDSTVIVKSVHEDASFGIDNDSVMQAHKAYEAISSKVKQHKGQWFAEAFLEGREFNVSVMEIDGKPIVMPIAEMEFHNFAEDIPRIMGYDAKWNSKTFAYAHTQRKFVEFSLPLCQEMQRLSLAAWDLFGLQGYARIDFRCDIQGKPYILEVNPNPSLSPDAGFAAAALEGGIEFNDLIAMLISTKIYVKSNFPLPFVSNSIQRPEISDSHQSNINWRQTVQESDIENIRAMISNSGFFNSEEVDIALELVDAGLKKGSDSGYEFLMAESNGHLVGYTCYSRIPGTQDSYDLYWIAVDPSLKRQGFGAKILDHTEQLIKANGGKRVYIETAGKVLYLPTQAFYLSAGYNKAAELHDYYAPGDAQITFVKVLS